MTMRGGGLTAFWPAETASQIATGYILVTAASSIGGEVLSPLALSDEGEVGIKRTSPRKGTPRFPPRRAHSVTEYLVARHRTRCTGITHVFDDTKNRHT